jgi:hypothetical protein
VIDLPWTQISGAVAGGLVGGFAGFVANIFQERHQFHRTRKNVACALLGEIDALRLHIEENYLAKLRADLRAVTPNNRSYPYHAFRGERDYMPVFRSLGSNIGVLASPLPRDLVRWYTRLAVCLERAHVLHELTVQPNPEHMSYAAEVAELQHAAFSELVELASPLVDRLSTL